MLQLSEAILDLGRMLQSYYARPLDYVMVEIAELAFRLRETPQTIEDALLLLKDMGRADPYDRHGRWILRLGNALDARRRLTLLERDCRDLPPLQKIVLGDGLDN